MAKTRKRKPQKRTVKRGINIDQNILFWLPVQSALAAQASHPSIARVSTDPIGDRLAATLTEPLAEAIDKFRTGKAVFQDFWAVLQTVYFLSHATAYVLRGEKLALDEDQYALVRLKYTVLEDTLVNEWHVVCANIGERHKRTGKYGVTGDELLVLERVLKEVEELMGWGTVRMVYHAQSAAVNNLINVEHKIKKDRGWL